MVTSRLRLGIKRPRVIGVRLKSLMTIADKSLHRFSSTQFNMDAVGYSRSEGMPGPRLKAIQDTIADADLAEDGKEENFHVTVKYGFHEEVGLEDVRQVVRQWLDSRHPDSGWASVTGKLGDVTLFEANGASSQRGGAEFDVVKVDVESADLISLNTYLSDSLPHTDTHPKYHPHITLAYVKPGLGKKYAAAGPGEQTFFMHRLVFSDVNKQTSIIDLWKEAEVIHPILPQKKSCPHCGSSVQRIANGWRCGSPPCEWSFVAVLPQDKSVHRYFSSQDKDYVHHLLSDVGVGIEKTVDRGNELAMKVSDAALAQSVLQRNHFVCRVVGKDRIEVNQKRLKAMSAMDSSRGGALVPPPQVGRKRRRVMFKAFTDPVKVPAHGANHLNGYRTKSHGTCKPGQRSDLTGCTPAMPSIGKSRLTRETVKTTTVKPKRADMKEPEPKNDKIARAKAAHVMIARTEQQAADEVERHLAKQLGGVSFKDSEPVDIVLGEPGGGQLHGGIELKVVLVGKNDKLTMNRYAQVRKIEWERKQQVPFHTVVIDNRNKAIYYRRGVAGSARLGSMYRAMSMGELKKLISMSEQELPEGAKRTDEEIRHGHWKFFQDNEGKGYKNSRTGEVVRPKK